MNNILNKINIEIYIKCSFEILNFQKEDESQDYYACAFELNNRKIICRNSKVTPKKLGQFVTFWKRDENKITIPYKETDDFDFYVINVKSNNELGQFVFPKSALIQRGIISTDKKDGKRGFRVYPKSVKVESKQAQKTQKWQLEYFYELSDDIDFARVIELYEK